MGAGSSRYTINKIYKTSVTENMSRSLGYNLGDRGFSYRREKKDGISVLSIYEEYRKHESMSIGDKIEEKKKIIKEINDFCVKENLIHWTDFKEKVFHLNLFDSEKDSEAFVRLASVKYMFEMNHETLNEIEKFEKVGCSEICSCIKPQSVEDCNKFNCPNGKEIIEELGKNYKWDIQILRRQINEIEKENKMLRMKIKGDETLIDKDITEMEEQIQKNEKSKKYSLDKLRERNGSNFEKEI